VAELGGEKIDIIPWHEDPAVFVANALSPAQVVRVDIDEENRIASVTVPERMLSLAIGREGQNARLAAKLTGWRIDIRSDQAPPRVGPAATPTEPAAVADEPAAVAHEPAAEVVEPATAADADEKPKTKAKAKAKAAPKPKAEPKAKTSAEPKTKAAPKAKSATKPKAAPKKAAKE
jgi:N utilization substance protein A